MGKGGRGGGGGTDEPAGGVDACVARPDAGEPLGHAELEEALFRVHCDGWHGGWLGSGCARSMDIGRVCRRRWGGSRRVVGARGFRARAIARSRQGGSSSASSSLWELRKGNGCG